MPAQHLVSFVRNCKQLRNITWTTRAHDFLDGKATNFLECFYELENRGSISRTQVDCMESDQRRLFVQSSKMSSSKVSNMDVVSDSSSVFCVVVGSKDCQVGQVS